MTLLCIASLLLMAVIDFHSGQEIVFSCAYLVPVLLASWYLPRSWMFGMAATSGISAYVVDVLDGYEYSHPGIGYWNAGTCFLISIVSGIVLSRLRQTLAEREAGNAELRAALQQLEESTLEIRKLQSGLQTVCAWTKRIKVGDSWMSPDEFLTTQLHLQISHGISPDAYDEFRRKLPAAA